MQLHGIHHLTAVTANAPGNFDFYTRVLGLRLVKKTVNQDDVSAYHLFYADGLASPGSDLTFFDWPAPRERRGTSAIIRTGLRLGSDASFDWWAAHLAKSEVSHSPAALRDGRLTLDFEDFEGQRFSFIHDGGQGEAHPWDKSPVPAEHQIRGLGPITISVPKLSRTEPILLDLMQMRGVRQYELGEKSEVTVFEMGAGGAAAELHVAEEPHLSATHHGAGGVHHVAFRTTLQDYKSWQDRLAEFGVGSSGPVDRFYFRSLYFREPSGILFELATDEPGFTADEPLETLGQRLSLPPFLEARRDQIEKGLSPLITV